MTLLRFLTAGESHGPKLTAILEGMVAGLPVSAEAVNRELARRQVAYGAGGRMKIERDEVSIPAGVVAGHTTGAPITLEVINRDYRSWAEQGDVPPMTVPRPGHADPTGALKYGYRDLRPAGAGQRLRDDHALPGPSREGVPRAVRHQRRRLWP